MSVQVDLIKTNNWLEALVMVILSIIFSILSIGLFIAIISLTGVYIDIGELLNAAVVEVISNRTKYLRVFFWATPLMLSGLAVAVAFQAGLFNIGGQGQMIIGGVFSAIWAAEIVPSSYYPGGIFPFNFKPFVILTTIIVGFLGGAIWGFVPGYLKAKTGAHEVIVTIMMNLIAISFVTYLVGSQSYSPFVDSTSVDAYSQSNVISESARIGPIFPSWSTSLNWTTIIALFVVVLLHIIVYYSNYGFKLRAVGFNQTAARTAGINTNRTIMSSMALSGGLAGLAGVFLVIGKSPYRYVIGVEGSIGFDGIAVALIAQNSPLAIAIAALLFGFLQEGKNSLDTTTDIPPDLIFALQAFVIIFVAAPAISRWVYQQLKFGTTGDAIDLYEDSIYPPDNEVSPEEEKP